MKSCGAALLLVLVSPLPVLLAADHNLSRVVLAEVPHVSIASDPSLHSTPHVTFSVFPYSFVASNTKLTGLMEKQALYALRNALEARGYEFVPPDRHPDLFATLQVLNEYRESYIPPRSVTVPAYVPSQSVQSSWRGSLSTWGTGGYTWGTMSGTGTTTVPGYWTTNTVTKSGYVVGYHYPAVGVYVLDGRTFELAWQGTGVAMTREWDARLAMQVVLRYVADKFPRCSYGHDALPTSIGRVGAALWTYTNDGDVYYPTVLDVVERSSADRAGLKEYDMIVSVDGAPTANRPFSEILKLLAGAPTSSVALGVKRRDRVLKLTVQRDQRSVLPAQTMANPVLDVQPISGKGRVDPLPAVTESVTLPAGTSQTPQERRLPQLGMTPEEVGKLLGRPRWTSTFQGTTRWAYDGFSVIFENARVVRIVRP